ncbi:MAG: type III secretion system translocon subunit SctE [Candidatus Adiutrix sp.]|jgi:hypothetical protein|nr:type III secretion system translocon subunit SctE [Candidatus Adiutrix sp.]
MSEISRPTLPGADPSRFSPLGAPAPAAGTALGRPAAELPPAGPQTPVVALLSQNPELAAPLLSAGLALEVLVQALGDEERKTAVKTGLETLKAKGEERKANGEKQLAEMKERLEKMREQAKLSPFLKAFKWIGAIVGAIAAVATLAVGVLTANPLMIAGGVILATLAVDSIVNLASDGKYGIAQGISAALVAMGVDETTAKWVGLGVTMALAVTGAVCGGVGAFQAGAAAATNMAVTVAKHVSTVTTVISTLNTIAESSVSIYGATLQYDVNKSLANSKELQAILENISEATETEQQFLKFIMEKYQDLVGKVTDIVKQSHEAQAMVLTGGEPAPA